MKKMLSLLLSTVVVFAACNSPQDKPDRVSDSSDSDREQLQEKPEAPEVLLAASEDEEVSVSASSVLVDNTNIGFNYEPEMVLDKDFSTAWCGTAATGDEFEVTFNEPVKGSVFGIVPGFARDETIYKQNNRIKEMTLVLIAYDDSVEELSVSLDDDYGMHFVDVLEGKEFKSLALRIDEVYSGSKYEDTCIAEFDFWSDYVLKQDAGEALEYYVNFRKDDALKPFDVVGAITISDLSPDSCGNPVANKNGYDVSFYDDMYYVMTSPLYFSAYVNEYGELGDELDATLYWEDYWRDFSTGEEFHYAWWVERQLTNLKVEESCSGQKFVHFQFFDDGTYPMLDSFRVDLTKNGKLVGRVYFRGSQ